MTWILTVFVGMAFQAQIERLLVDMPPVKVDAGFGESRFTCADKRRFLMTSENGKLHCILIQNTSFTWN